MPLAPNLMAEETLLFMALLKGQHVGDDVVVKLPKGKRELVVDAVE